MKWCCLSLPALVLMLSACSTTHTEVIRFADDVWRAPTNADAANYCKAQDLRPKMIGRAPGESGVLFRCV